MNEEWTKGNKGVKYMVDVQSIGYVKYVKVEKLETKSKSKPRTYLDESQYSV